MAPSRSSKYTPLSNEDVDRSSTDAESLLSATGEKRYTQAPTRPSLRWLWPWLLHSVLLLASFAMLMAAMSISKAASRDCIKSHSAYSIALDAVDTNYETVRFDGSFRTTSPYKGEPRPELDAAWDHLTKASVFSLTDEDFVKANATHTDASVKLPPEMGGGYMATLEFSHQIHCVELLWQYSYKEYYADRMRAFTDSPEVFRTHLNHCADVLRQKLMCDSDVGLLTYVWVKGFDRPMPNFNTQHKCRKFEKVLHWSREHEIPLTDPDQIKRPEVLVQLDRLP